MSRKIDPRVVARRPRYTKLQLTRKLLERAKEERGSGRELITVSVQLSPEQNDKLSRFAKKAKESKAWVLKSLVDLITA